MTNLARQRQHTEPPLHLWSYGYLLGWWRRATRRGWCKTAADCPLRDRLCCQRRLRGHRPPSLPRPTRRQDLSINQSISQSVRLKCTKNNNYAIYAVSRKNVLLHVTLDLTESKKLSWNNFDINDKFRRKVIETDKVGIGSFQDVN